jgi:hypothetical protein
MPSCASSSAIWKSIDEPRQPATEGGKQSMIEMGRRTAGLSGMPLRTTGGIVQTVRKEGFVDGTAGPRRGSG